MSFAPELLLKAPANRAAGPHRGIFSLDLRHRRTPERDREAQETRTNLAAATVPEITIRTAAPGTTVPHRVMSCAPTHAAVVST